jgi:hypothetical protein
MIFQDSDSASLKHNFHWNNTKIKQGNLNSKIWKKKKIQFFSDLELKRYLLESLSRWFFFSESSTGGKSALFGQFYRAMPRT